MKRKGAIVTFLTLMLSSLVSAGPVEGVQQLLYGLRDIIVIIIQFVGDVILDVNSFDEFLFAKIILFIIILTVVYTVIKKNPILGSNKTVQWIVAIAVSLLSIRFLPDNFVEAILLQYGALGAAITIFLPLAIYFFFLHQSGIGPFGRRAGWIIFAASFFAMWGFRYENLGSANWIYWIAITFMVISFMFDKSIHTYFGLSSMRKYREARKAERRVDAQKKLQKLEDDREHYSEGEYNRAKERLSRTIKQNL